MKTRIFFSSMLLCMAMTAINGMAQDVPNGTFANWENRVIPSSIGGGTYSRPTGGWDCLNSLAPGSCTIVEGRTAGSTAALLTSKKITVEMDGGAETTNTSILMLGDFLTAFTAGDPSWGIPFTAKPKKFTFWYKYLPKSGDKGRVMVKLWKGTFKNNDYSWVSKLELTETVSEWTKVEIDMTVADAEHGNYMANFIPDGLLIEATSSITGLSTSTGDVNNNTPQEGSQLYITDMAFEYQDIPIENYIYTIIGNDFIFGSPWNPQDTSNDMTPIGDNTYQLIKNNVALVSGTTYLYQLVQNHDMGKIIHPSDGDYFTFTVPASDSYNVTFTFRPDGNTCTAKAVSTSSAETVTQIPNGSFANWEDRVIPSSIGGGTYSRPTGGWDCTNMLASGSVTKVDGRASGLTAALLTTKKLTVEMDGQNQTMYTSLLTLTDYIAAFTMGEPSWGIPFSGTPKKLTFWYKYNPMSGDKGRVFVNLWKGDYHEATSQWRQKFTMTETVGEWTKGEIDLTIGDKDGKMLDFAPDHLLVEATSSISGMSANTTEGEVVGITQEGSQLWITELQFTDELNGINGICNDSKSVAIDVYDVTGRKLTATSKGINIIKMSDGQVKKVLKK